MSPGEAIDLTVATAADAAEMARVLADAFAHGEPMALALGVAPAEFAAFVRLFDAKAAAERLSFVARSRSDGAMRGALLAQDAGTPLPDGFDAFAARLGPAFDVLAQLDAEYLGGEHPQPGDMLHLFMLGVPRPFEGDGIGRRLLVECLATGARRGYHVAFAEATNPTSQHVLRQLGFVERVHRSYADHRFDGRAPFASIAAYGGPILMDKRM